MSLFKEFSSSELADYLDEGMSEIQVLNDNKLLEYAFPFDKVELGLCLHQSAGNSGRYLWSDSLEADGTEVGTPTKQDFEEEI